MCGTLWKGQIFLGTEAGQLLQELWEGRSGCKSHGNILGGDGTVLDSDYGGNDTVICACQKLWSCTIKCLNFTVE